MLLPPGMMLPGVRALPVLWPDRSGPRVGVVAIARQHRAKSVFVHEREGI